MLNRPLPDDIPLSDETAAALKLWVVLSRAYASVYAHAFDHAAEHELSLAEFAILDLLYHRGPKVLGEIQRRILVSSGGITFLVDRLVKRGLVVRQESSEDRRTKRVSLTRDGTRFIREIFPSHAQAITEAMWGLSPEQRQEATHLLRTLGLAAAGGGLPPSPNALRRPARGPKAEPKKKLSRRV